jgi:hypothetical protein
MPKVKKAKMVRVTHCGVTAEGKTVTEARVNAEAEAGRMLSGDYTPNLLSWRGHAMLVWREPLMGWCTRLVQDAGVLREGNLYGCGGYESRGAAVRSARLQLAQLGWNPEDQHCPAVLAEPAEISEFKSWVGFQLAYRKAMTDGRPLDHVNHQWACEHAHEFAPTWE